MAEPVQTRSSLLVRVRDPGDNEAWRTFLDLYAPLLYGCGRKSGLQDADAADLTQTVGRPIQDHRNQGTESEIFLTAGNAETAERIQVFSLRGLCVPCGQKCTSASQPKTINHPQARFYLSTW